jgi:hypothetical protein
MPVTAITRQARSLDTEHSAHAASTYLGNQSRKARAIDLAGTGSPEILINDLDLLETQ